MDLMAWDARDRIELIDQPLLMIAGEKADSLYMTEEAFAAATGTKDKRTLQDSRRKRTSKHISYRNMWMQPLVS